MDIKAEKNYLVKLKTARVLILNFVFNQKSTMAQQLFLANLLIVYSSQLTSALVMRKNYGLNGVTFEIAVYNVRFSMLP